MLISSEVHCKITLGYLNSALNNPVLKREWGLKPIKVWARKL